MSFLPTQDRDAWCFSEPLSRAPLAGVGGSFLGRLSIPRRGGGVAVSSSLVRGRGPSTGPLRPWSPRVLSCGPGQDWAVFMGSPRFLGLPQTMGVPSSPLPGDLAEERLWGAPCLQAGGSLFPAVVITASCPHSLHSHGFPWEVSDVTQGDRPPGSPRCWCTLGVSKLGQNGGLALRDPRAVWKLWPQHPV